MSNETLTVAELLREVKKPGRIYAPVLVAEDVIHLQQIKAEIVWRLEQYTDPTSVAPWQSADRDDAGNLWLDNF